MKHLDRFNCNGWQVVDGTPQELGDTTIFFLHGFNVPEEQARGWSAEMFKRLRRTGSNACLPA